MAMDLSSSKSGKMNPKAKKNYSQLPHCQSYLPPCRVCGGVASGLHYGLNTCEACKGFYKRSSLRKLPYAECKNNGDCKIESQRKNLCSTCRYHKCVRLGMSKLAIRTGRYTVRMKTLYTLEIKMIEKKRSSAAATTLVRSLSLPNESASSSAMHCTIEPHRSANEISETPTLNHSPQLFPDCINSTTNECTTTQSSNSTDISQSSMALTFPASFPYYSVDAAAPMDDHSLVQSLNIICHAFREGFPETVYMFEHSDAIDRMLSRTLREMNLTQPTNVMIISLDSTSDRQKQEVQIPTTKEELLNAMDMLNSSVSSDLYAELLEFNLTRKELFATWCTNVEKFVIDVVTFARKFAAFNSLPLEDQKLVTKCAKPEVAALAGFKHFHCEYKVCVNYHAVSRNIVLFPLRMIRKLFYLKDYSTFYRLLQQMNKLDIQMPDLAVLCALTVFSPDREGLTDKGRHTLSKLQDEVIPVLRCTLGGAHPKNKSSIAKFLMVLPNLHQLSKLSDEKKSAES